MTSEQMYRLVAEQARLLGPRLYEGMAVAIEAANTRARGLAPDRYPHLRPLITRAEAREYFERTGLPVPWRVGGNPVLMGQLYLDAPVCGLSLRMLKERRRTYPNGVPVAGSSNARVKAWQEPLPFLVPAELPRRRVELLLLWDYRLGLDNQPAFTLRIVHPVEPGVYGRAVRCDLDLEVRTGGSIFETLVFTGDSDDEDFFEADIDRDENDGQSTK